MKFKQSVVIHCPLGEVLAAFEDPTGLQSWMKGLTQVELMEGIPGTEGAKSKLTFELGKRSFEMIETIERKNLPEEFTGTYEMNGVLNRVENRFNSLDHKTTKYETVNTFKFKGMMKILAFFMPSAFRKQSMQIMNDFKRYAEKRYTRLINEPLD